MHNDSPRVTFGVTCWWAPPLKTGGGRKNTTILLASLLLLVGCAAITGYDPTSYKTATDLKAEALVLIEKATDPPGPHKGAIDGLRVKLRQAWEYEKGKGSRNRFTSEQWRLMIDPQGNLLGGFLAKWESSGSAFGDAFLQGVSKNVGDAFDRIIELESHKVKD